jgi:hypothetical protein
METRDLSPQRRNDLLAGFPLDKRSAGLAPQWADVSQAPVWVQDGCLEIRLAASEKRSLTPATQARLNRNAEMRSGTPAVRHAVRPPLIFTEDQALKRLLAIKGEEIRVGNIKDPSLRAVKFRNGRWYRDFEKERELAAEECLFGDLSANGTLRLQQALEAKMRSYDDDDYDEDDDSDSCITPEDHAQAALYHRARARKAADWQTGAAHFTAADLHEKAAGNCTVENHCAACAASRKLRK